MLNICKYSRIWLLSN